MRLTGLAIMVVAACYRPAEVESCAVHCGPAGECPSGMSCGTNQLCHGPGVCAGDAAFEDVNPANCFGGNGSGALARICLPALPTTSPTLATGTFDTSSCPPAMSATVVNVNGVSACAITGIDIEVMGALRVQGSRPLVLFASGNVTIDAAGSLNLVGDRTTPAAGADLASCQSGTPGSQSDTGPGGGAGGSFGTLGGEGGRGATTNNGHPNPNRTVSTIEGGCSGTRGGAGAGSAGGGLPGGGGGAVYVIAGNTISIAGFINASGQGGLGGVAGIATAVAGGGGGGGGSGGLIGLDAPHVVLVNDSTVLIANGGGGGGAAGDQQVVGGAGGTPTRTETNTPGSAGSSGPNGGMGGTGSSLTFVDTPGAMGTAGGGGGGGGAGAIRIFTPDLMNNTPEISPPLP